MDDVRCHLALIYLSLFLFFCRLENLDLMLKHGPDVWKLYNRQLEAFLSRCILLLLNMIMSTWKFLNEVVCLSFILFVVFGPFLFSIFVLPVLIR